MPFHNFYLLKHRNRVPADRQNEGVRFRSRSLETAQRIVRSRNDELAEEHHITRRRRESATSEPFTLKNQKRSVSLVIPRNTMLMDSMKNATDDIRLNLYNIESPPQASRPPQESRAMPRVPSSIEEMIQEVKTQINGLEELVGSLVEM